MGVWRLGRFTGQERSLEMELWYVIFGNYFFVSFVVVVVVLRCSSISMLFTCGFCFLKKIKAQNSNFHRRLTLFFFYFK